ncbi:MAG: DUF3048 domain-containing protein [Oscillospiraceae bacterium]|nr:DUF3048 domain-containing protein [Oscillospiraceae bacterium]
MKKLIALTLVLALLLCGCGSGQENQTTPAVDAPALNGAVTSNAEPEAEAAATEPTAEPTTEPTTEPVVYYDPLNGEILDAPFDGRIYASTISNIRDALPHVGVTKADILMETFVNGSIVRGLALYSDLSDVEAIGSTRSTRLMFNDIAEHYNAILTHAGGSSQCLDDATQRGLDHYNVDSLMRQGDPLGQELAYRDEVYKRGYEHCLFVKGPSVKPYAESKGVQVDGLPETDYGLTFVEDGTPVGGETADRITMTITYNKNFKDTIMDYDASVGKYVYNQYGSVMCDQITGEAETFENVVVMYANITMNNIYQVADFVAGGTGYYACGGKIIPITWTCDSEQSPFRFFTADGEPLSFGQGNTYIAITQPDSKVVWEAHEPAPAAETTAETLAG